MDNIVKNYSTEYSSSHPQLPRTVSSSSTPDDIDSVNGYIPPPPKPPDLAKSKEVGENVNDNQTETLFTEDDNDEITKNIQSESTFEESDKLILSEDNSENSDEINDNTEQENIEENSAINAIKVILADLEEEKVKLSSSLGINTKEYLEKVGAERQRVSEKQSIKLSEAILNLTKERRSYKTRLEAIESSIESSRQVEEVELDLFNSLKEKTTQNKATVAKLLGQQILWQKAREERIKMERKITNEKANENNRHQEAEKIIWSELKQTIMQMETTFLEFQEKADENRQNTIKELGNIANKIWDSKRKLSRMNSMQSPSKRMRLDFEDDLYDTTLDELYPILDNDGE